MKSVKGLLFAFAMAGLTACASGGGGGGATDAEPTGSRPQDDTYTNAAGVHLAQAALGGENAQASYQSALSSAIEAIQADPDNPKAYLLAGQAAIGLNNYVQADTMFDRAEEIYPDYQPTVASEREQGWVNAYNLGVQAMNEGNLERAQQFLEGADALYQERPEAKMALGGFYTRQGETEQAIEAYSGAYEILSGPPPEGIAEDQVAAWDQNRRVAAFNTAQLMAQAGRHAEAAEVLGTFLNEYGASLDEATRLQGTTARAGFLAQAGRTDEAEALYNDILTRPNLTSADYFQIGIGFFETGDYERAAEAFGQAAELNPYSRDALLNLVQSAYSATLDLEEAPESPDRNERLMGLYDQILEAGEQVREFDPLNRDILSFMLRTYRAKAEMADDAEAQRLTQATQELFREYQQQPYQVGQIALVRQANNRAQIRGTLTNLAGTAGEEVTLEFSILGSNGQVLSTEPINVTVPAQTESAQFSTTITLPADGFAGWRYELGG